jgi:hypothetical protein
LVINHARAKFPGHSILLFCGFGNIGLPGLPRS